TGREYDSGDYAAVLDKALQLAEYEGLRAEQRRLRQQGRCMGIGIATTVDASGFGPASALSARPGYEGATVRVEPTGTVTVLTGSSPHGQGMEPPLPRLPRRRWGSRSRMSRWCMAIRRSRPGGRAPGPAARSWWAGPPSSR